MTVSIENTQGGVGLMVAKIRKLLQDGAKQDQIALELGVGAAALKTMLETELTRLAP